MQFDIVDPNKAKAIRDGSDPQWKAALLAGQMLLIDGQVPQWGQREKDRTGRRIRSKAAGEGKRYVWLEDLPVSPGEPEVDPLSLVG